MFDIELENKLKYKEKILMDYYLTGRIEGLYMGKKSKVKKNPVKEYIKMRLANFGLYNEYELIEECYQTLFLELFKYNLDKFTAMMERSPNGKELQMMSCRILVFTCFTKKGLVHNILNKSSFGNVQISTNENYDEDSNDNLLIIYDEQDADVFQMKYNLSIEELLESMTNEDREYFYTLTDKKRPVGKPTIISQIKKQEFYSRVIELKNKIIKEDNDL